MKPLFTDLSSLLLAAEPAPRGALSLAGEFLATGGYIMLLIVLCSMASVTVMNIALGSRAAVRGAKVQQKRTVATKKVAAAARAELSNGESPARIVFVRNC